MSHLNHPSFILKQLFILLASVHVKKKFFFSSLLQSCMHFTAVTIHSLFLSIFWVFPQNVSFWNLSRWSTSSLK